MANKTLDQMAGNAAVLTGNLVDARCFGSRSAPETFTTIFFARTSVDIGNVI